MTLQECTIPPPLELFTAAFMTCAGLLSVFGIAFGVYLLADDWLRKRRASK